MLTLITTTAVAAIAATATQPASVKSGVERWRAADYPAAVAAWLPFAAQGDPDALFNLGQAYKLGRGVTRDPAVARDYYRRAAAKGHLPAQANLGIALFQAGDKLEAVRWLKQAADRGEPRAQYVLGIAAYNGDGTPKNLGLAYGYLLRAKTSGLVQATTALGSIEPALPPEARSAGEAMAASLAAGTGVPPALAAASAPRTSPAGIQRSAAAGFATATAAVRSALGLPAKPPAETAALPPARAPLPRVVPPPVATAATRPPADIAVASVKPAAKPPLDIAASARPPVRPPADITAASGTTAAVKPPLDIAGSLVRPPPPPRISPPKPEAAAIADATPKPAMPAPKPAAVAAADPVTKPPVPRPVAAKPPAPTGWRVQLGAFSSQKQADAAWASVKASQAGSLGKAKPIFDTSGPVVKFQLGPYASRDAARDMCAKLAFAGKACFVTQG